MVSPGTLLVQSHESLSITNESQFTKTRSSKLKLLGPLCNQSVNLETDAKTLYYSLLKLKYNQDFYITVSLKRKKDSSKYASLNSRWNHKHRTFYHKIFKSIDHSLHPMGHMLWIILCLWGFLCLRDVGSRGNKITVWGCMYVWNRLWFPVSLRHIFTQNSY